MMPNPYINYLESATLSVLAVFNGTLAVAEAISESDWTKLTGQHGAVFVLAIVGLAFWAKSVRDEKNRKTEDEARERRHKEALAAGEAHFSLLIAMNGKNASDLKEVSLASVKAQVEGTNAIENLTKALESRPCQKVTPTL